MKKLLYYTSMLLILVASLQLQSCKKEKSADPEVQSTSVTALGPGRALMKGNILSKGNYAIKDYGFIYSTQTSGINENVGVRVSLGTSPEVGEFSKEVDAIISNGYSNVLYVRAYLTNEKGTAFGALITVNMPVPAASSVTPSTGRSGDQVTIGGQFYNTSASNIKVTFGGIQGNVVSASSSQVVVQVPSGVPSSHGNQVPVVVSVGGQNTTASTYFTMMANIKDYSPKSGPMGTVITFSGDNLPSYYSSSYTVSFGSLTQSFSYYSSTLQAAIPANITTNNFEVSIAFGGKTFALPGTFNVVAPTITSISPTSALPGASVTVSGTNLPTGNITASLGGVAVSASSYGSSQFVFPIPNGLSAGDHTLTLTAGPHTVSASQKLKVISPALTGFSPTSGSVGRQVILEGTFVPYQYYQVSFGSVNAGTFSSSNGTTLPVYVPSGVSAGNVRISAVIGGQTVTAPGNFTVTAPVITSFTPASGVAGTIVTISGTGFNNSYANVTFGTVNANVLSVTDNTIRVVVPSNTGNGAMKISVNINSQLAVSTDNFTVTN